MEAGVAVDMVTLAPAVAVAAFCLMTAAEI